MDEIDGEDVQPFDKEDMDIPEADADVQQAMAERRSAKAAERIGTDAEWDQMFPGRAADERQLDRIRAFPKPIAPSQKERERHELCHCPCRIV